MPNWCSSNLIITGKKEELQKFKEFAFTKNDNEADEEVLDTEKFVPFPKEFYEQRTLKKKMENMTNKDKENQEMLQVLEDKENPFSPITQYDWCCTHWGTKWGICHAELEKETDKKLTYYFETAWSPCHTVIMSMSNKFPTLKFVYKYYEQGMGFSGKVIINKNKVIEDKHNNNYRGGRGG